MRIFVFLCVLLFSYPALGQDEDAVSKASLLQELLNSPSKKQYKDLKNPNLYKDVPYSYIVEAQNFHEECLADSRLFQFYDCKCLSVKFLDRRVEVGPGPGKKTIMLSLQGECKDGTYVAGMKYEECMNNGTVMFSPRKTPEEYCACLGNETARLYESRSVLPGTYSYIRLVSQAHLNCQ